MNGREREEYREERGEGEEVPCIKFGNQFAVRFRVTELGYRVGHRVLGVFALGGRGEHVCHFRLLGCCRGEAKRRKRRVLVS